MRYIYCSECKEPISARSTFEESVIRGVQHKKKLKSTCGMSNIDGFDGGMCRECHIKLKVQFGKLECDCKTCRKVVNGFCDYALREGRENPTIIV